MSKTEATAAKTDEAPKTGVLDIQAQIRKELEESNKRVQPPSTNRISTAGKRFKMPNGQIHQGPMHAVILDFVNLNRWYSKPYDANNPVPPDCFAIAVDIPDLAPHENSKSPQAEACDGCPKNEFGSAAVGRGKACRNAIRLAVVTVDNDGANEDEIYSLELPPSSITGWASLYAELQSAGRLPIQVQVEISFKEDVTYPVPLLKVVAINDKLEAHWGLRSKARQLLLAPPADR